MISEEDFNELRYLMEQEQAEKAMRDVIKYWHKQHLPLSMELKGIYDSLITVGFDVNQATLLTIAQLQQSKRDESTSK